MNILIIIIISLRGSCRLSKEIKIIIRESRKIERKKKKNKKINKIVNRQKYKKDYKN